MSKQERQVQDFIKVVYFDVQSASDYLDMAAGGKVGLTSEQVRKRTSDVHAKLEGSLVAKFSWLPFLGGSAEAGAGSSLGRVGESILSKTLSNTILTDYLEKSVTDSRIARLVGIRVTAAESSIAYAKMFTPYLIILKTEDQGVDLARFDEALASAKGYYELVGTDATNRKAVLRFNIQAFRNNYGLADLGRMRLVYHGIYVGRATEASLDMNAELSQQTAVGARPTAREIVDGGTARSDDELDVFDILLAGVVANE